MLVWALIVFVALSQWVIFSVHRDTWFDEAFSLETIQKMRGGGVNFSQYDVHPPIYYYGLYIWSYMNPGVQEDLWAREFSVLIGVVFFIFVFLALKKLFGSAGEAATVMLAASTTYLHYFSEIRMYGLMVMVSAIIFWCVVNRLRGQYLIVALVGVLLLPLIHYFSGMAVFFFVAMYVLIEADAGRWNWSEREEWWPAAFLLVFGLLGVVIAATQFAIPQAARLVGTWLPAEDITQWPSAVFSAFFFLEENVRGNLFFAVVYVALLAACVFFAYKAFRWMMTFGRRDGQRMWLLVMGLAGLVPVLGLLVLHPLGQLYHHRYFLVVTWMFAAMVYVAVNLWVGRPRTDKKPGVAAVIWVLVWCMVSAMLPWYDVSVHRDLQEVEAVTPCVTMLVVHESAFSSIPFTVYSREHGCGWLNLLSTNLTWKEGRSAGFDAISPQNIYWNSTAPGSAFFYVDAAEMLNLSGRTVDQLYQGDGVRLLNVSSSG